MSEHPFAVITKGFSPVGMEVGYALKKDFAVAFFDKFDLEKRNQVIEDGLSYSCLLAEDEASINQTLQAVMVCFANVRLLVNIIEPKDVIDRSIFKVLDHTTIKEKVSAYIEGTVSMIRVIARQMCCQTDNGGFKGHIINIINCGSDSDSKLVSSMISGAITSMTSPLSKLLKPYHVRMNSIVIESRGARDIETISQTPIVKTAGDLLSVLQNLIEDTTANSLNIQLRAPQARL